MRGGKRTSTGENHALKMEETDFQHPKYPLSPLNIENSIYIYKSGSWVLGVLGGLETLEPKKPRPPEVERRGWRQ